MKVLIADDESVVLEGLKYIIDWDALGFSICSQASNGEETLNKILNLRPELVLLEDICLSYQDASRLLNRRFFCEPNQHVLGYGGLPPLDNSVLPRESWNEKTMEYSRRLTDYIQTQNRTRIAETLKELESSLYHTSMDIPEIKHYLIDIYLQVKQNLTHTYSNMDVPFSSNATIIDFIENQYYLYEILQYFSEHFEICMNAIGSPSSKTIIDDILYYINHNYRENLKMETIAPLFGYDSSYLGKIFTR